MTTELIKTVSFSPYKIKDPQKLTRAMKGRESELERPAELRKRWQESLEMKTKIEGM